MFLASRCWHCRPRLLKVPVIDVGAREEEIPAEIGYQICIRPMQSTRTIYPHPF